MSCHPRLIAIIIFLASREQIQAQTSDPSENEKLANTADIYYNTTADQSGIYNGSYYYRYPEYIHTGHLFFQTNQLTNGSLLYDGRLYENVPLLYDEGIDELITPDFKKTNLLQLVKQKVERFSIAGHQFINIGPQKDLTPGYYRLAYSSRSQVLAKETKRVRSRIQNQVEENRSVVAETAYYVKSGGKTHKIDNAKTLSKLFGDKRKQVAENLKQKNLKFKSDREQYIIEAVTTYDKLAK